ncbi:YkvA family protein [Streptococcus bovimastitidis]|uniref:YkvA family protein n=1 Tax=Streptococcus bovimastitidis TaxID=1856638 RepID=UPI001F0AC37F|nr:YkvA family protein [Streptococcus bovimastitidis]
MIIVYSPSPIDLIPDFIPVLGHLDDVLILPLLITLLIKLVSNHVWQEAQAASKGMWQKWKT